MRLIQGTNGYDVVLEDGSLLFFPTEHGKPTKKDIDKATTTLKEAYQKEKSLREEKEQLDAEILPVLIDIKAAKQKVIDLTSQVYILQNSKDSLEEEVNALQNEKDRLVLDIGKTKPIEDIKI